MFYGKLASQPGGTPSRGAGGFPEQTRPHNQSIRNASAFANLDYGKRVGFPRRGLSPAREKEHGAEVAVKFPKVVGLWGFLSRISLGAGCALVYPAAFGA